MDKRVWQKAAQLGFLAALSLMGGLLGGFSYLALAAKAPPQSNASNRGKQMAVPGADKPADFVLRDRDDQIRLRMGIYSNQPALEFFDENGKRRMRLWLESGGQPALDMFHRDGGKRVTLSVGFDDEIRFMLRDPAGNPRVVIGVEKDGPPLITLLNEDHRILWRAK